MTNPGDIMSDSNTERDDARPETTVEQFDVLVEHWFFDAFHGSVVARSTEVWNCCPRRQGRAEAPHRRPDLAVGGSDEGLIANRKEFPHV
jgi:hypothetical protein